MHKNKFSQKHDEASTAVVTCFNFDCQRLPKLKEHFFLTFHAVLCYVPFWLGKLMQLL